MTLSGINFAISTISREESYLPATLERLSEEYPISVSQPVSLVVGSPVTQYLDPLRARPGITLVEMGPNTWAWIERSRLYYKATWNYYRCLTQCAAGRRGTLILEDDVRFARGWRGRLETTLAVLEDRYGTDFVLTLYAPLSFGQQEQRLYADYPLRDFYGTQAVYYTAKIRKGFAKCLKTKGLVANANSYDGILRDYLLQEGLPLFVTTPTLVQHMGKRSTGLGHWHDSPDFVEDVTALNLVQDDAPSTVS